MRRNRQMSILPLGMDGGQYNGSQPTVSGLPDWHAQRVRSGTESTIRTVTPDLSEKGEGGANGASGSIGAGGSDPPAAPTSPRSIPAGDRPRDRRHGLVFEESYSTESLDGGRPGPPVSFHSRPRTRTLDESTRNRSASTSVSKSRHRIGSVHSTTSTLYDAEARPDASSSLGFPSIATRPSLQLQKSNSVKGGRRLVKRSSRPTSPLIAMNDVPSIDSLPYPVATGDANKILMLMRTLCGRMRGEVEYQAAELGPWYSGICYIDDSKGALMYDGDDRGPFHLTIVPDLRGCRIRPVNSKERSVKCLEISNRAVGLEIRLLPLVKAEFDLWLAALLCWQQIRNGSLPASSPQTLHIGDRRPSVQQRRDSTQGQSRDSNIIKVAKLLLWDKGAPSSPSAIVRRPSTRDLQSPFRSSWRRVSCILQDNGEFKLLTENDITLLSVIQLSQLSRSGIQRLDRSVLDEEFCIGIFPQYTSTSTQLSILRPVYISLESRILYEVWFCLLRAFCIPEIYGPQSSDERNEFSIPGAASNDMFRIEKSLTLRVVEAKIRKPPTKVEALQLGKHHVKSEQDSLIGDYFAEVLLDGEVRSRTVTKPGTRNPFWREDCEFQDLPAYLPRLCITLKKLEHLEVATHGFLSSSSVHVPDHPREIVCGTVEIPMDRLERGKDFEAWYPIISDQQDVLGEMFLKVRHDELVVLLAKDYQEISELLHRFSSGLTIQISQAIPTQLRKLSIILMNIFQVSGHAGEWLMALVEDEIDGIGKEVPVHRYRWSRRIGSNESSVSEREQSVRDMGKSLQGEANLLFRGNSLLTQALDFHMRRLGKEYLEETLSEQILKINALNPDCEVDPSRLSQGDDISKNWSQLKLLTTSVWDNIADSASRCPPEIRQILKYIRAVAEDRYGDFLRTVAYTSVSGFLFLRFFCPALLNPKLFGLLRDHPQPKAQRTLTLIAKSLQVLANLSTFGQKEEWMEPMNKFLSGHRQAVKDYIDGICSIPSERNTFALPASYSTPITILARLPPTSREGFPSLPYLIDHAKNFSALVKLWLDSTAHHIVSQEFEGDLLAFHRLCINLRRRTDECLNKAEGDKIADHLSVQWEDIVEGLESSSIQEVANPRPDILTRRWTERSASVGAQMPPGSAGSEAGGKEPRVRESFWEQTFGKDDKQQRPYNPADSSQASPPNRGGQSKNGKPSRGFLSGIRRKAKEDVAGLPEKDRNFTPGSSYDESMI